MPKYKLEDFKNWLEERPGNKNMLAQKHWDNTFSYLANRNNWEEVLQRKTFSEAVLAMGLVPWDLVAIWKAEVDQRERERESKIPKIIW